ncbi:MAG: hypothetical protein IIC54_01650, partial [Proteobacteria bacterium]|nr:hypothetical protein [Pseudomonadota bacterium]
VPGMNTVHDIDISTADSKNLALGDRSACFWMSRDSGTTWNKVRCATGSRGSIRFAPSNPQRVYASNGISEDGGATWRDINPGRTWTIAVHPQNPDVAYYGAPGYPVRATTDGGKTFYELQGSGPNIDGNEVERLAIDPVNDILYVAGDSVFKGTDASLGTKNIDEIGVGLYEINFTDLKATDSALWVSSDARGIHKSDDKGFTWSYDILGTFGEDSIRRMAPDPSNPLIAYADHETRVYKTVDGGKSWSTILRVNFPKTTLDHSETNVVYVSSDNSILRSDDGGINWKTLAQGGGQITVHPVDHNIIYTVYQGSLYKSLDKGDTWSALGPTPGGHLYIIPLDPDTMYLSNDLNGLHLSTDGGATWSRVDFGGRRAKRLIQTLNGDLWIADFQKGLFRSVDNGRNWALTLNVPAWRLAADPWDSESLFVIADQKVFWVHPAGTSRTIDTGGSGGQLDPPASFRTVDKCQVIERSNTVYSLVNDLSVIGEGSCLLIARFVHDVTIEGNGHTIRFAGAGDHGIVKGFGE